MSLNSSSYMKIPQEKIGKNYEKKKEKLIKEIKKIVEKMQQEWEEPLSDEEYQELIEFAVANINEKRNSLDERKIWERCKFYIRRKKLLAEEILRLKKESDEEKEKKVDNLKHKLNNWENNWNNSIKIPTITNTFKKK